MKKDTHVVEAHTTAAQEHENTAKSHRAAAENCSKGAHEACEQHARTALEHSVKAQAASKLARSQYNQWQSLLNTRPASPSARRMRTANSFLHAVRRYVELSQGLVRKARQWPSVVKAA